MDRPSACLPSLLDLPSPPLPMLVDLLSTQLPRRLDLISPPSPMLVDLLSHPSTDLMGLLSSRFPRQVDSLSPISQTDGSPAILHLSGVVNVPVSPTCLPLLLDLLSPVFPGWGICCNPSVSPDWWIPSHPHPVSPDWWFPCDLSQSPQTGGSPVTSPRLPRLAVPL